MCWSCHVACKLLHLLPVLATFCASQMALVVKNLPVNAGEVRDMGSIPGSGRSPGVGNGKPTPVFLPGESPWTTEEPGRVHSMGVAKSWTRLSD